MYLLKCLVLGSDATTSDCLMQILACRFLKWLIAQDITQVEAGKLKGKPFAVLGLGSSCYPRFCAAADLFNSLMLAAGAPPPPPPRALLLLAVRLVKAQFPSFNSLGLEHQLSLDDSKGCRGLLYVSFVHPRAALLPVRAFRTSIAGHSFFSPPTPPPPPFPQAL